MEVYFSTELAMPALIALGVCALASVLLALLYIMRVESVVSARYKADRLKPDKADGDYEPATIVVYSQADADSLSEMLPVLLSQDYPVQYEVVVVNEGESADVRDAVSMLRMSHPNLYLTFTPDGVRNLSRKKLALTLGVKAARYDVVVLTTTAALIHSDKWLRGMMSQFSRNSDVGIVLGYAAADTDGDSEMGRRMRSFDFVADSVRWLAPALAGHPFRGTEYNLAYRKELFMRNNGFSRSLNLHAGDDDIFISEICRNAVTAVELSSDSIVGVRYGNSRRAFREQVLRRCFTESFIRRRPRVLAPMTGWLQMCGLAAGIYASVVSLPNLLPAAAALFLVVVTAVLDIVIWRRAMKALCARPLRLTLPWLSMTYPLRRISRKVRSHLTRQRKYTWM